MEVCREQVLCSVTHFRIIKSYFPFYNSNEAPCSSITSKVTPAILAKSGDLVHFICIFNLRIPSPLLP